MELESDLSKIQSEELLRKMWQQSEDINRKKEIRSQLYKLRELRLRDLYQFDIMSDNRVAGFGKDPLAPSHGESLADQSFQSLKTKEIRDSMSPTEMKFQSMALNNPNTTGWNVQSSSEVSPDGRGFRAETVATTDGVENINGGTAEFKGRNEQRSSAMHEGDDKNFVKKASESSNTHLQEKVVVGDENSGRTEVRTSSSTSTSSSKVFQSSSTTDEYGQPVEYQPQYLMDSNRAPQRMQAPQYHQHPTQYEPQMPQEVRRSTDHATTTQQQTEQYNQNRHETNTSQNVQTNEKHEQNKRYVDVDKASPEYQQHVQYLMAQPGEIISNTVEYPKPNVKMITTVKRLPDGTIVRNKRYETEETTPSATPPSHTNNTRQTVTNNTTQRRDSQTNQPSKNYQGHPPSERMRRPNDDVVDNVETTRYVHDAHRDSVSNVETKYSTVKTSNRKFSTETTSETIQESDDSHYPSIPGGSRPKPATNDFSTHGFPSVRSNKPTQEFATDRPQSARPNQGFPSQNMTAPRDALIPTRGEFEPTVTERRIPTNDGEVIIVSSEKKRNVKQQTNSERIIETDIRTTDDNRYHQISDVTTTNTNQDYSTHGFPSVKEPNAHPTTFPDHWPVKPQAPTPGYPVGARPAPLSSAYAPAPNDDGVQVSSQKSHTSKHSSNVERIIETEILGDDGRPLPRAPVGVEYITNKYTVTTPGDQVPHHEFPGAPRQSPGRDHPTQGFPSVRSPTKATSDYSTHGFPSARDSQKPSGTTERPQTSPIKTHGSPSPTSTKPNTTTIETTKRVIQKEKEVDSAHRAFAASLRSSSPVDSTRRDSYSTDGPRHTPRSSVSSTKPFRRDVREGSHDSAAGSETSRMSSTTVTRQTPPRTVGGKTVVTKQTVVTTPSPRGTKSPSPGKTVTTTTTTRTVTGKAAPRDVPKSDNQHTTTTTTTSTTKPDTTFPINHDSLTITKKNISDNQSNSKLSQRPVVEEPCIKKQYYLLGPSDHPTTAHKQEPSPRSSPAPSSRSSPYPSKSKSPMGDDDQTVKSHTSRPLSPSYTSRSPKPIGSKDVPNSRDSHPHQRPTKVVTPVTSDERRTVDREDLFEEIDKTSSLATRHKPSRDSPAYRDDDVFITEDYLLEDVDATQNMKRKTKQLIVHEKEPVPHRGPTKPSMVKTTSSPQEPHRMPTDVTTRRTDRVEETKRPRPSDHSSPSMKQPLTPKSNVSPKPLNGTERKIPASPKAAPTPTHSPRKPQSEPKPTSRITSDIPKNKSPQHFDHKRQSIPKSGSPERIYPTESENEPFTSKPTAGQRKPQPHSQPRKGDVPKRTAPQTPKPIDDERRQYIPRSGSPDPVYPSDTEDEAIVTNVTTIIQTTNKNEQRTQKEIDAFIQDDYTSRPKAQEPKNYGPRQTEPKHYPVDKEPTSESPQQQPTNYGPGQRKPYGYTNDQEPTSRPIPQQPKTYGPGPTDYPGDKEPETREPSRHPQQQPKNYETGPREPTDYSDDTEPTSWSPQQKQPKNYGKKEPTAYPGDKEPGSKSPQQQQPKNYGPGPKEPKSYTNDQEPTARPIPQQPKTYGPGQTDYPGEPSRYPQQQPENYESGPREPTDYSDDTEPTSGSPQQQQPKNYGKKEPTAYPGDKEPTPKFPQQQPKNYGPGPKEPQSSHYSPDREPTSKSPQQQPKSYGSGPKEPKSYTNDQEPTSRPIPQQPKTYGPGPTESPGEPSRYPQQQPKNYESGPREPTDYSDDTEPTSGSPQQQQPKNSEKKEPTAYPGEKEPTPKSPQQQPKNYGPGPKEPKSSDYSPDREPTSKSPQQQPKNYGPGPNEPKSSDYSPNRELTSKSPQQQPKSYGPGPKEPKPTDLSDDKERDLFMSTTKMYMKNDETKDTTQKNITTKIHDEFFEAERTHPELPDGAFVSKSPEEPTASSHPTYKKKGVSRRDTFEDRCRQILGMENYGETPGAFKKRPADEVELLEDDETNVRTKTENIQKSTFEVKIEDCGDDDDEPLSISSVKKTLVVKKAPISDDERPREHVPRKTTVYKETPKEPLRTKPNVEESFVTTTEKTYVGESIEKLPDTTSDSEPETTRPKQTSYETVEVTKKRTEKSDFDVTKKPTPRSESPTLRGPKESSYKTTEITKKRTDRTDLDDTKTTTSRSPTRSESPMFGSPKESSYETVQVTQKRTHISDIDVTKKPTSRSPTRAESPTFRSPKETSYETVEVTKKRGDISKKPTYGSPRNSVNETIEVTNKRFEKSKPTGKSPTRTQSPTFRTPKETAYETIEVTNKRIEKPKDVSKKPTSKSPTRSLQSTPELPKRPQPTKTDSNKKPSTKKSTDDKPYYDSLKEPRRNKPNEEESFVRTTEQVYVSVEKKEFPETTSDSEPETAPRKGTSSPIIDVSKKRVEKDTDIKKRPTSRSPTKSVSPTFETPKRKPSKPSTTKQSVRDETVTETASIKDRLRSSVRKDKSPKKPDQVDAGSSPETSPTRYTERRRSSNISVSTEIIIEHTESETAGKKPEGTPRKPKDSTFREIIDSTIVPDKMPRKMPVTERKESAPVHRVTRKDNDSKMSRSTSEKLIKVMKKPETTTTTTSNLTPPSPKMSPKPSADHRRPNKCFATKTINLSTTDRLVSSEDMENVIIDIQHAKSSREPSPDKIVPTPVPAHFDTGKPRYPDVVQEPEDEPRKKPVIKNIPIFEEEQNTYVGCHITEVNLEKNRKNYDRSDYREDDVLSTPVVEAPPSLDYPTSDKSYPSVPVPDDEYLLSVHDKVSKFQHIAEEVRKPKASSPFNREFDDITRVPDDDECLLTVDKKVEKFIKTAESLTNQPITPTPTRDTRRPLFDETDEDLDTTECTFTSVKLAPTAPQKSPELVRHISRHISRQSDGGEPTQPTDAAAGKHTYESREEYESKRTAQECVTHRQPSAVKQQPQQQRRPVATDEDDDYEELVPHTASHTTRLEQRRQKDILTRPSVFDNNNTTTTTNNTNKQPSNRVNKTQPKYVSPSSAAPKDSEKPSANTQPRPKVKSRVQPEPLKQYTNEKTATTSTTTTTTTISGANKRQPQSPQRRVDTDYDNHRRGSSSNVTTSVSSTTNRQTTKPYSTNGPKKSPQSLSAVTPVHKKPDRQTPLHTNKTKNSKHDDDDDGDGDDDDVYVVDDYTEFQVEVVPNDSETELIINSDTARRSTTTKTIKTTGTGKINVRKEPTTPHHTTTSPTTRKMKEIPQGSTPSSSSPSPPTKNTKAHVANLTERSTQKHNTTNTKSSDRSEINESFLDSNRPPTKNSPYTQRTNKAVTTTDSVAARRSLFENHNSSKPTSTRVTPTSSPSSGRRPSYMDHTKSSLEHIRRDSLELNKTNYTRKPSGSNDDELHPNDRSTQVKFDVPHQQRPDLLNTVEGDEEDMYIEEIFELEILERMLETVTSYELRRRIRAQIRLVKKNLMNVERNQTSEVVTTSSKTSHRERSLSPESITKTHVTTRKQYFYKEDQEEERRSSSTHTSPERTKISVTKITRTHSPEPNRKSSSPSHERGHMSPHKPSQARVCSKPQHGRSPSPETKVGPKEFSLRESTQKQFVYHDDQEEQVERVEEMYKETSPITRRPSRKSVSPHSSPERHQVDNTKPSRVTDRSSSPREKKPSQVRVYSKSPENKVSSVHKSNASYEQSVTVKQQKRVPTPQVPKTKPEQKAPVWADRKNVLKTPNTTTTTTTTTTTPRKPATVTDSRTSSLTKTIKSRTNQSQKHTTTTNKSSYVEDDCITSSYGIGPTDENGLPLFGIRALKKKKPTPDPCETTEEVTGYVVEEKYYSDNKSKPIVERKELIYSTNPEELNAIKGKAKETTVRSIKAHGIGNVDEPRPNNSTYKTNQKTSTSVRSSPEEFLESSTTKYVRRGSVKEMSEKFIHKESSSTVSEKSNNYTKAGLILRTNSRKHSRDSDAMDGDNIEYYETRTHHQRADSEEDDECLVAEGDLIMVESESESESIKKTQREFKKITSTKSSSSRSFLNTKGEQKVVTSVDDVLDRMRNADNVVEEGDTAEDQEARALLNKFLGASIIMKGVESTTIPINRETKMITTTTTGSGRQPAKHEVKTTRVTKTIKSGGSSSPVIETTCDIEEIWDEEILKQLLEQARTYEERRKIRSRLRELMADRAEKNCQQAGKEEAAAASDEQSNVQRSDSSASEYEEIIEEVTDDSDEAVEDTATKSVLAESDPSVTKVVEKNTKADESSPTPSADTTPDNSSKNEQTSNAEEDAPPTTADSKSEKVTETEKLKTPDDITDSSEQDAKQQQSSTSRTEKTETKGRDGAVVTTTTKVTTRTVSGGTGSKTVSPFTKFKQLDRQNSQQSTKSPTTPSTPGGGSSASPSVTGNAPIFKFTDPALNARAATVKDQLLQWCQSKTKEYENVQITNFSACWVDGLAFCALIHHFLPDAFDYSQLTPQNRRKNFELAFTVADEKAGIAPLLDVEDMVVMKRPDWKCVFVYVQSIYRRFRNCQ